MKTIKPLTSLRAFLALWVICRHLFHFYDGHAAFDLGRQLAIFDKGYLGVDGFFILSGFILAYSHGSREKSDYTSFIVARVARVYPVYLTCLLLAILGIFAKQSIQHVSLWGNGRDTVSAVASNILMVNSWRFSQGPSLNDVAWSVSAEWFAYVFFPVFVLASSARPRIAGLLLTIPALTLACVELGSADHLSIPGGLARLVPEFYAGVLLFRIRKPLEQAPRSLSLVAIGVIGIGLHSSIDTLTVCGLGALIFALSFQQDLLARLLCGRLTLYVGEISYCIYMVQRFPMDALIIVRHSHFAINQTWVELAAYMMTLFALAALMHALVESPCRAFIRNRFGRRTNISSGVVA